MEIIEKYFSDFSDAQLNQFRQLQELYTEWNQKINVISRKDMENFYLHHVLHSLAIASAFEFLPGTKVMDLGTGGGFPGIPLAIFFSEVEFLLVDSINKKLKVIDTVAAEIGLKNISTRHSRAEDIKDQKFDTVVSRAVAPLKDLVYWSKPLLLKKSGLKQNGLICLKGGDLNQEIAEAPGRPRVWKLSDMFTEDFFREKFLLHIPAV